MPTVRSFIFLSIIFLSVALPESHSFAGPRVEIVIGEKAPALERLAADELSNQLKRVYEADVKINSTVSADAPHVIFVGSPDTNAGMKPFAAQWPSGDKKLTDQGHLLRSVTHNNKPALLIGGGSPVATYWAVAEFGHHLGIRSMLFGDLDPVSPPPFLLAGIESLIEPTLRSRGWFFWHDYFQNSGAWTIEEYQRCIRQLAKLRFTEITIQIDLLEPYLHLEYEGIQRTSFLGRPSMDVSGDTAGRKAFGGTKTFGRAVFAGASSYSERRQAAQKFIRTIIETAHEVGIAVNGVLNLNVLPVEFAPLIVGVKSGHSDRYSAGITKVEDLFHSPKVTGLFQAHFRSVIESYPTIDGIHVVGPWVDNEEPHISMLKKFLSAPGLLRRADGRDVHVTRMDVVGDPVGIVTKTIGLTKELPSSFQKDDLRFAITPDTTLPHLRPQSWSGQWRAITQHKSHGFDVSIAHIGDCDLPVYWLSRLSVGNDITPEQACRQLLEPTCGNEVDHRVWKALGLVGEASAAFGDSTVTPENLRFDLSDREFNSEEPPPPSWSVIRDKYLNAMNEMYRANTRAREGGRTFTLYLARRFEFAFEYMNCIEAVRKAAVAERKKDSATQIAELEKAIEALNNALNAMAAVARSNSDRGLIAVLNEYGYRPLKKKLAEAEEAK